MSGMYAGAITGLARRVELPETKTALNLAAIVDLALFPVVGAFAGGLITGD